MKKVPKSSKMKENGQMEFVVQTYLSGITTIEGLAIKLQEACLSGKVTGLKKSDPEAMAKKDLRHYKKTVNWYLNRAKHRELIDAPLAVRKKKILVDHVVAAATQSTPAAEEVTEVEQPVESNTDSFIPTI